jgi:regulator of sigma E protease
MKPIVYSVPLRTPIESAPSEIFDSPVSASALGVAYHVLNRVDSVLQGSPAAKAEMQPGDVIVKATLIPPDKKTLKKLGENQSKDSLVFNDKERNWPPLMSALQNVLPGTTVELTFSRNDKEHTVKLDLVESADWFNTDRGFLFEPMLFERKASSIGDAFVLGGQETLDNLTIVIRTVKKLGTNQVSMKLIGGPVSIFWLALQRADEGNAVLLLFLTFLSANLAVLNFLPIPVLDGGHFMLLAYEGIRGKPANEHVQTVLAYIGLILILALMVWAFGLDLHVFSRR